MELITLFFGEGCDFPEVDEFSEGFAHGSAWMSLTHRMLGEWYV
jgi:hypothetical protein